METMERNDRRRHCRSRVPECKSQIVDRGWMTQFPAAAIAVRNLEIVEAFEARCAENERRIGAGLPPRTRRRRAIPGDPVTARSAAMTPQIGPTIARRGVTAGRHRSVSPKRETGPH